MIPINMVKIQIFVAFLIFVKKCLFLTCIFMAKK